MRTTKTAIICPDNGMTLVETIMAIAIFGIFISGVFSAMLQARKMSDTARSRYQAVQICKNRIERANSMDFPEVYYMEESGILLDESGTPDQDGLFRRRTEVSFIAANLWEVTVAVEVMDREMRQFSGATSEVIKTYICDYVEP